MKEYICYISLLAAGLLTSCVGEVSDTSIEQAASDRTSLKSLAESQTVDWTLEESGDDDTEEPSTLPLGSDVSPTPATLAVTAQANDNTADAVTHAATPPVYPRFTDGFSLDTSKLDNDVKILMSSFLDSFSQGKPQEQYVAEDAVWTLVLFSHDLNDLNFKYEEYVFGEPFIQDNFYQCPVRLCSSHLGDGSALEYIDIYLYVTKGEDAAPLISQIEIFNTHLPREPNEEAVTAAPSKLTSPSSGGVP